MKPTHYWFLVTITTLLASMIIYTAGENTTYTQPPLNPDKTLTVKTETTAQPTAPVLTAPPEEAPEQEPHPNTTTDPNTLTIDSLGFTLPLAPLTVGGAGTITPPDYTHGFVLTDWGVGATGNPDNGSVYIITHSKRDGTGTGNYLFNPETKTATVEPATRITALGHEWEVTGSWHENKEALPNSERVWSNTPDTLYLITCLQIGDGNSASTDNFIVEATLLG